VTIWVTPYSPLELVGALSSGTCAVQFCTQPETWPVFMEYLASKGTPEEVTALLARTRTAKYGEILNRLALDLGKSL
jgi:hypothetical protein